MTRIGIVYHSMYGATHELAKAVAEGVEKAGAEAQLRRVPDPLLPDEVREQEAVKAAFEARSDVTEATVDELPGFEGILLGSPTRFGNRTSQLSAFLDQTGPLWQRGALHGKPVGFFTGAATNHGGHESTILTMSTFAYHQGMVIVPAGYALGDEAGSTRGGGGPYGPSHLTPGDGSKDGLSDDEHAIAIAYGIHFAEISEKLAS